ncbi:hypothetical protein Q1695_012938 [Nippostrongylus brasiliensis]|nr:hypothetical protein Q1695_012938 [Nippostrongylus brasiliensis]
MGDALPADIKRIIDQQTQPQRPLPNSITRAVLPKIGMSADSSLAPARGRPPTPGRGLERQMSLLDVTGRSSSAHDGVMENNFSFNYSFIPDHAVLPRTAVSTANGELEGPVADAGLIEVDRTFVIRPMSSEDSISVVGLKLATIPSKLPNIVGLQAVVDNLSSRRVQSIFDACRLYDHERRGYLSVPSMIKCIGEVSSASSPWRLFLNSVAPHGEFIEYEKLLRLIDSSRHPEFVKETVAELLSPDDDDGADFLFKPSTDQENRERCRAQVMTEIEVLLMRNPDLPLDRLKAATTQKEIEQSEFKMLLELYGLEEAFRPFYQRLVSCFLTPDNKIHFSAFVGCLALVRPPVVQRRTPVQARSAPWTKPPLAPISAKRNEPS